MEYLLVFNIEGKRSIILTNHAIAALENARQGDMINLFHYYQTESSEEYRTIKLITYNGNLKYIHLQDKELWKEN